MEEKLESLQITEAIIEMAKKDQELLLSGQDEEWKEIAKVHAQRLKEIIEQIGWPTISKVGTVASSDAWLLVQHANSDLPFQEHCLDLMKVENPGEVNTRNIAYLEDRVRKNQGLPQIYGTQLVKAGTVYTLEDPENVDQRRAEVGLEPLAKYLEKNRNFAEDGSKK